MLQWKSTMPRLSLCLIMKSTAHHQASLRLAGPSILRGLSKQCLAVPRCGPMHGHSMSRLQCKQEHTRRVEHVFTKSQSNQAHKHTLYRDKMPDTLGHSNTPAVRQQVLRSSAASVAPPLTLFDSCTLFGHLCSRFRKCCTQRCNHWVANQS